MELRGQLATQTQITWYAIQPAHMPAQSSSVRLALTNEAFASAWIIDASGSKRLFLLGFQLGTGVLLLLQPQHLPHTPLYETVVFFPGFARAIF